MKRLIISALAFAFVVSSLSPLLLSRSASAVTAADWKAGRIIDDSLFTGTDMNVSEIQNFLNSKVPSCDTNGTKPASEYGRSDLTHAQYAATRGWPGPPYVCLRNYYEVPKTAPGPGVPANNYSGSIPSGAISAAQMIYNAAQTYHISPKVLLVKLGTESAGPLTTDSWPLQSQYTYAMGAHCPDSGPGGSANCDGNYAGFSIQISEAAALLRYYIDGMTQSWWPYKKPFQSNYVQWNVTARNCGGSNVYLESMGTAALYTYTPYQPNAAALANMYGTGDNCSAYGNRNFWRVYNDWFGSTLYAQPIGGSLLYQSSTGKIYLTTGTTRYHIPSMGMLQNYGLDKYGVIAVSDARIQEFTDGGMLTNLVYDSGGVYLVNNRVRHHVSPDMCTAWNLSCYDSNTVKSLGTTFQTQFLSTGGGLTQLMNYSGVTYKMDAGKKLPISNTASLNALGFGSTPLLSASSLNANYPLGPLLVTTPGVVSFAPSPALYYFDGASYLRIPSMALYNDWVMAKQPSLHAPTSSYNSTPPASSQLTSWYQGSDSQKYIIDRGRKIKIPVSQQAGWQDKTFTNQAEAVANSLPTYTLPDFVWAGGPIYLLDGGTKRYVPRYDTYLSLRTSTTLFDIGADKLSGVPSGEMVLADGNIVALNDNPQKLFVLNKGKLVWIPNPSVYSAYGFRWGSATVVPTSTTAAYPIDTTTLGTSHSTAYYLPSSSSMYSLSDSLAQDFGLKTATITSVSTAVTKGSTPKQLSRFMYNSDNGKIYYASGGAIHYVATYSAFVAYGGTKNPASAVNTSFIDQFNISQSLY